MVDNLFKLFGPESGSKLFCTLMVFLMDLVEKFFFNQQMTKHHAKSPSIQIDNRSCLTKNNNDYLRPLGYKTFFMLNSTKHEISTTHKN